jgi:cytoskeletal protein RodZ
MDRRSFVVGIVVLLLCFVSACATQPETIAETVIVQITATSVTTVEPTQTEVKPTEEPSKASPTATSEPTSTKEPTATEEPETPSNQKNNGFYTVGGQRWKPD